MVGSKRSWIRFKLSQVAFIRSLALKSRGAESNSVLLTELGIELELAFKKTQDLGIELDWDMVSLICNNSNKTSINIIINEWNFDLNCND